MEHKRLTLFAGHYGSGKTNIAVNYALALAKEGKAVCIADLDIVNPYFRTKDSAAVLEKAGVELISPQFANTNVDLPALPAEAYKLVTDRSTYAIWTSVAMTGAHTPWAGMCPPFWRKTTTGWSSLPTATAP